MPLRIETERLLLRPLSEADLDAFTATLMSDPHVVRSFPGVAATPPGEARREFVRTRYFKGFADARTSDGFVNWGLFPREDPDRLLGWSGVHRLSGLDLTREGPELGYAIVGSHQGQGLMTEAARAVIEHAFTNVHVPCLHALIAPSNIESQRLALSLGFEMQGTVAAYGRADMQLYRLSRARFLAALSSRQTNAPAVTRGTAE